MRLKSYFADSVEEAIRQAGKELGSDAMLVYSREAPTEARYLGSYEVVFAVPPSEAATAAAPVWEGSVIDKASGPRDAPVRSAGYQFLLDEVASIRRQMNQIAGANMPTRSTGPRRESYPGRFGEVMDRLLAADVDAELLSRVHRSLEWEHDPGRSETSEEDLACWKDAVREELKSMFRVDSDLGASEGGPHVLAVVGPPGAGKTTALVKIAARYGLRTKCPTQILCMDMYRVGATEQLRSFAMILGIGFQVLDTPGALSQALEEHRHKDLVLIDTPGHGLRDIDAGRDLASFLQKHPEIDVHLTLSASMKTADLRRAADRYEQFGPKKLLFTRMDETVSPGTVLSEAARTGKSLSFLTNGQQIPEDIQEATKDSVLDLVFGEDSPTPSRDEVVDLSPAVAESIWKQHVTDKAAAA